MWEGIIIRSYVCHSWRGDEGVEHFQNIAVTVHKMIILVFILTSFVAMLEYSDNCSTLSESIFQFLQHTLQANFALPPEGFSLCQVRVPYYVYIFKMWSDACRIDGGCLSLHSGKLAIE